MSAFTPSNVKVSAGTIYAAPLSTTEPTAVTGAWPAGWVKLGYTDGGSSFSHQPQTGTVDVEEEYYPLQNVTTGMVDAFTFSLAETTLQNYLLALNGGIGTSQVSNAHGTNSDGSLWVEPPDLGDEVRVMLGWDALNSDAGASNSDPFTRLILRKCFQTGNVTENHQKGTNKTVYACTFTLEKPAGARPFRKIYPASLAS